MIIKSYKGGYLVSDNKHHNIVGIKLSRADLTTEIIDSIMDKQQVMYHVMDNYRVEYSKISCDKYEFTISNIPFTIIFATSKIQYYVNPTANKTANFNISMTHWRYLDAFIIETLRNDIVIDCANRRIRYMLGKFGHTRLYAGMIDGYIEIGIDSIILCRLRLHELGRINISDFIEKYFVFEEAYNAINITPTGRITERDVISDKNIQINLGKYKLVITSRRIYAEDTNKCIKKPDGVTMYYFINYICNYYIIV